MSSRFSNNSEALASELLENLDGSNISPHTSVITCRERVNIRWLNDTSCKYQSLKLLLLLDYIYTI